MAGPLGAAGAAGFLGGGGGGGAAAGAGMAALGPWMLGATALQGGFQLLGGIQEQKAMDKAITQAEEGFVRNFSVSDLMAERDKARQLAATREGHSFMNSPVFQQVADKKFGQEYALAGKYFNPYVFGQIDRFN